MPKLFEIFGYPLNDSSEDARRSRNNAECPYIEGICDGGGNRWLSQIDLTKAEHQGLREMFENKTRLMPGVCSIQLTEAEQPWIVCPRRMLALGRQEAGMRAHQKRTEERVLELCGYQAGTKLGIWSEVKLKYIGIPDSSSPIREAEVEVGTVVLGEAEAKGTITPTEEEAVEEGKSIFDYTFDYVIMPVETVSIPTAARLTGLTEKQVERLASKAGYQLDTIENQRCIVDFPVGIPNIVEIMTSSTSGGNKDKRSTISMSFEDVILGRNHSSPGINYRQVWARMVSQLLVKSEAALAWGGRTFWLVQDVLVDYICATTSLNVKQFSSDAPGEVNMLSFTYGNALNDPGPIDLQESQLYAGLLRPALEGERLASFSDIVYAPILPPLSSLSAVLASKKRPGIAIAP